MPLHAADAGDGTAVGADDPSVVADNLRVQERRFALGQGADLVAAVRAKVGRRGEFIRLFSVLSEKIGVATVETVF